MGAAGRWRRVVPNLDAALERTHATAPSTTVQGRRFERMSRAALLNHPGEFRDKLTRVCLWDDWPGRDGQRAHRRPCPWSWPRLSRRGVTGYRLAKSLCVADSAVRKHLRQAHNLTASQVTGG